MQVDTSLISFVVFAFGVALGLVFTQQHKALWIPLLVTFVLLGALLIIPTSSASFGG